MRPGQQRPGNDGMACVYCGSSVPSMRPGQQRPGNLPGLRQPTPPPVSPFNEAGATTPRKFVHETLGVAGVGPSMRPGQQRPGNPEARPGRADRAIPSMRPGQQRPGNLEPVDPLTAVDLPSMRPGQQRPGNRRAGTGPRCRRLPSMRPGQQRPGNPTMKFRGKGDCCLQ